MLPFYGMGLGAESGADEETAKALAAAAAASSSTHSAFSLQMYNQMLAYSSMLAQSMGMTTPASYAQALASAGNITLFNMFHSFLLVQILLGIQCPLHV